MWGVCAVKYPGIKKEPTTLFNNTVESKRVIVCILEFENKQQIYSDRSEMSSYFCGGGGSPELLEELEVLQTEMEQMGNYSPLRRITSEGKLWFRTLPKNLA